MIRAALGRLAMHCIEKARQAKFAAEVRQVDLNCLTDAQISDWVHGRPVDLSAVGPSRVRAGGGR